MAWAAIPDVGIEFPFFALRLAGATAIKDLA
jgi:hypothetical protein